MPTIHSNHSRPSPPHRFSPKHLLTRGLMATALLAGAGAALSAGPAQASWGKNPGNPPSYTWTFPSDSGTCVGTDCTSGEVIDKKLTVIDWTSVPSDSSLLNFSYNPNDPTPFAVDLEFDSLTPAAKDFDGGSLFYSLEITDPTMQFDLAELGWNSGEPSPTVTKQIYSSASTNPGSLICTLNADPSQCAISGSKIWVRDTWGATTAGIDNVSNDYRQTSVPGPLPLLGAGMAFGFSRKLRRRIQGQRVTA